jgi:hypothetical protein
MVQRMLQFEPEKWDAIVQKYEEMFGSEARDAATNQGENDKEEAGTIDGAADQAMPEVTDDGTTGA